MPPAGLRERKKQQTWTAISDAALRLFLKRGFDSVSITEVAAAANVSRRTLFAYFPTKEDLVVRRFADHEDEAARAVRGRRDGAHALTALREHFLDGIRRHDPFTGCSDLRQVLALYRLVLETPALGSHLLAFLAAGERALADALVERDGLDRDTSRLVAAQVIAVQRALSEGNYRRIVAGRSAAEVEADALAAAAIGFDLLRDGVARALPSVSRRSAAAGKARRASAGRARSVAASSRRR
jgi:AcrR family transcriptional regulator